MPHIQGLLRHNGCSSATGYSNLLTLNSVARPQRKQAALEHATRRRSIPIAFAGKDGKTLNLPAKVSTVTLKTLSDCQLAVSIYPEFSYNAAGGGGSGTLQPRQKDGKIDVSFDASTLNIPPLCSATTKIFGIPLPPPLNIAILPNKLQGFVDVESGEVSLEFDASFQFTAGPIYKAPPLSVVTVLTSESSSGKIHTAQGQRLQDGKCRLVGVARVPTTVDWFANLFLMLPTDALAVLSAEIEFS